MTSENVLQLSNQVIERCGSTNDLARALGEAGAPHGTWISACVQEKGRGRLGRGWESAEGNLFVSLVARLSEKSIWTWVPLASAVGITRYLTGRFQDLDLSIKWPNDLWIRGSKLGGILCEAVGTRQGSFIVVGIGLNCVQAPGGLNQATTSLSDALSPARITADDVRPGIVASLLEAWGELESRGTGGIVRDYELRAALRPGNQVEWGSGPAAPAGADRALDGAGEVQGLGPSGELIVRVAGSSGELRLFAEDVRIRFPKASGGFPA